MRITHEHDNLIRQTHARNMNRKFLYILCLIVMFIGGATSAAFAQTSTGDMGWSNSISFDPANSDSHQGKSVAQTRCAACHGADGNNSNPQYPKLAGQDPSYLYSQLRAFSNGDRPSEIMSGIVASLSASDATDVVGFYAEQVIHPDPVKDGSLADSGRHVFITQVGPGSMNACIACHDRANQQHMPMMGRPMM